jgi:threonine dehydratase
MARAMNFLAAAKRMRGVIDKTPLIRHVQYSDKYECNIFFKREDMQTVRSFKIRGAYNKISSLDPAHRDQGVVCASAGNHAQGFAYSCNELGINGDIFIPEITPKQKISRIQYFGGKHCNLHMVGTHFSETMAIANEFANEHHKTFIHPFNDIDVIEGQGTIGLEIDNQLTDLGTKPDIILTPIGGGGLAAGLISYFEQQHWIPQIYGVEPQQCQSMELSVASNSIVDVYTEDSFVDGATVNQVGNITFDICKHGINKFVGIHNGELSCTMIDLFQNDGIITEPAGALSVTALDKVKDEIKGKTVVVIISGGNNDFTRYPDILNKALIYQNKRHYFIVKFSQTPGRLRNFIENVLGKNDDIIRFEYIKKTNNDFGQVLIGIEVCNPNDINIVEQEMYIAGHKYVRINDNSLLFNFFV